MKKPETKDNWLPYPASLEKKPKRRAGFFRGPERECSTALLCEVKQPKGG